MKNTIPVIWCDTITVKPMFSRITGIAVFNFTSTHTQAVGGNMKLKNSKWCLYSGDIYKDGFIDLLDMIPLDNDAYNYVGGWVPTDLNGDLFVNLLDMIFVDKNSYNYVGVSKPVRIDDFRKSIFKII